MNIFCNEKYKELLFEDDDQFRFSCFGIMIIDDINKRGLNDDITLLKKKNYFDGPINFSKFENNQFGFYKDLIDLFIEYLKRDALNYKGLFVDVKNRDIKKIVTQKDKMGIGELYYILMEDFVYKKAYQKIGCKIIVPDDGGLSLDRMKMLEDKLAEIAGKEIPTVTVLSYAYSIALQVADCITALIASVMNKVKEENLKKFELANYYNIKIRNLPKDSDAYRMSIYES
ncbi:MAG: hypothetical protein ACRQFF_01280 [Sphaerochaeta sp.]